MTSKLTYSEQLRHPNWQRRRLEMLGAAAFECSSCGCNDRTLHVHHKRYVKGRMAWEYEDTELAVLCLDCHEVEHASRKLLEDLLFAADPCCLEKVIGLAAGYLAANMELEPDLSARMHEATGPYFEIGLAAATFSWDGLTWRDAVIACASKPLAGPVLGGFANEWLNEKEVRK